MFTILSGILFCSLLAKNMFPDRFFSLGGKQYQLKLWLTTTLTTASPYQPAAPN